MMSSQVQDEETKIQGVEGLASGQKPDQNAIFNSVSPTTSFLNDKAPKCCELFKYDAS